MTNLQRTPAILVFGVLVVACVMPICDLASIKLPAMVLRNRAEPFNASPTSPPDKAFADLDAIAKAKDLTRLAPAITLTPASPLLFFTPNLNAHCRAGPETSHSSISIAMKGQSYPIDGRNPEGTWYLLSVSPSAECWVFAGMGSASGDASGVRVIQPIPTPPSPPRVPPNSCSQYTTPQSCSQHPECTWNRTVGPGACQAK